MEIQELTEALSTGIFIRDGNSSLIYRFDPQTMKLNNSYLAKWNLYKEDSKLFLRTEPSIKEDFLIEVANEQFPLSLNLSAKFTGKHFITLTQSQLQ